MARFMQEQFGAGGTLAAIAAAGLADSHAGALTAASVAALSAVGVNTVVKVVLTWTGGGHHIAGMYFLLMIVPIIAVAVTATVTALATR